MKKWFILAFALALTLGMAAVTMAGTLGVAYGYAEAEYQSLEMNFNQVVVSYDMLAMDNLLVGASVAYGACNDTVDSSILQVILKGEYAFLNEEWYQVAAIAGYYMHHLKASFVYSNYSINAENNFDSPFLGLTGKLKVTELSWLDLYYAAGLQKIKDETAGIDGNLGLLSCKFYYMVKPRLSMSIGYFREMAGKASNGYSLGAIYNL